MTRWFLHFNSTLLWWHLDDDKFIIDDCVPSDLQSADVRNMSEVADNINNDRSKAGNKSEKPTIIDRGPWSEIVCWLILWSYCCAFLFTFTHLPVTHNWCYPWILNQQGTHICSLLEIYNESVFKLFVCSSELSRESHHISLSVYDHRKGKWFMFSLW